MQQVQSLLVPCFLLAWLTLQLWKGFIMFFQHSGKLLLDYIVSYPWKQYSSVWLQMLLNVNSFNRNVTVRNQGFSSHRLKAYLFTCVCSVQSPIAPSGLWRHYRFIQNKKTNSMALSPRPNYTDWATATCRWHLVPSFVDRGVSRGQHGGSPTVVNLSFLDRIRYFFFK
jgi:hypothetical protein